MTKNTAKSLAKLHGIEVKHALFRKSGDWYHIVNKFPAALFDEFGFIKFDTSAAYNSFVREGKAFGIYEYPKSNQLSIRGGISNLKDYIPFEKLSVFPVEIARSQSVVEGALHQKMVNFYERDPTARETCIKKWGLNCIVCGLNFEQSYGEIGEGFIHVHHLAPISSFKKEYILKPEQDLRPVCPNCHAMLHRTVPPLPIEELIRLRELRRKSAE